MRAAYAASHETLVSAESVAPLTMPAASPVHPPDYSGAVSVVRRFALIEQRVTGALERVGPVLLRVSFATVFIWFGALKVAGASPAAQLVAESVSWVPGLHAGWFVQLVGWGELALGLGLLTGMGLRLLVPALVAHLVIVTILVLVQPDTAFQSGLPMALTAEGQYVIKNLVLFAGAVMLGSRGRRG